MTGSFLVARVKYGQTKQELFQKGQAGTIHKSILHILKNWSGRRRVKTMKVRPKIKMGE